MTTYPRLKVCPHARNRGYGAALKTGIRHARSDSIAIIDADLTYPATDLARLIEEFLSRDTDMIVGSRLSSSPGRVRLREFTKYFLRRYSEWIVDREIPDLNSGLRVFRKSIAERYIGILPNGFSFTTTITLASMSSFYDVRYQAVDYRVRAGKSKIQPIRDTLRFLNLIIRAGLYFAPYRIFLPIGILCGIAAIVSGSYDFFIANDLSGKTLIFTLFSLNIVFFAILAEIIDRRSEN